MLPILFKIGPINIYSFGFFLTLAYLFATFILWREGKKQGFNEERLLDLSVLCLLASIIGSRLYFVVLNWPHFSENLLSTLYFWQGGMVYHGALFAVILTGLWLTFRWRWPFFQIADIASLSAAVALTVGKIGTFLAGLDYGKVTSLPWGVSVPSLVGSRHPVQIYEAAFYFILFVFLYIIYFRNISSLKLKSGKVFFLFLIWSSLIRGMLEYLRAQTNYLGPLPLAVWNSALVVLLAIAAIYYFQIRNLREDLRNFLKGRLAFNEKILRRFKF